MFGIRSISIIIVHGYPCKRYKTDKGKLYNIVD